MAELIKITKLPQRAILKSDGVDVVLNQEIPIEAYDKITCENPLIYRGVPYDSFNYKIVKDSVEYNEATVTINFETKNDVFIPYSINHTMNVLTEVLFSSLTSYEDVYDRIVFNSAIGKGEWLIGEEKIEFGKEYFAYNIFEILKFKASEKGAKLAYNALKFQIGNKNELDPVESFVTVDTETLGISETFNTPNFEIDNNGDYNLYFQILVKNGFDEGTAEFDTDTNLLTQIIADPLNYLKITSEENPEINITTQTVTTSVIDLNKNGECMLNFHLFLKGSTAIVEPIDFELKKINTSALLVDPANLLLTNNTILS